MSVKVKLLDGDIVEYTHTIEDIDLFKKIQNGKDIVIEDVHRELLSEAAVICYNKILEAYDANGKAMIYQYNDENENRQIHVIQNVNEFFELKDRISEFWRKKNEAD